MPTTTYTVGVDVGGTKVAAGLVDELFLTLAPVLAAGGGPSVVEAPPLHPPVTLQVVHLIEHEDVMFLRYRVSRSDG